MAPNYEIVAVSEAYESHAGCLNGVKAVLNYCDVEIIDMTIEKMTESLHIHEEIVLELDKPPVSISAARAGKVIRLRIGACARA
jgi:hypothetical protein